MENKIPEWYLPLLERISKNLNEEDLQLLNDIKDKKIILTKDQVKYLLKKMLAWLNTLERLRFWKMLLQLSIKK